MSGDLNYTAELNPHTTFESPERSRVVSYERALRNHASTEILLQASLAREAVLLRQRDEWIGQQEVFSKLLAGREDAANRVASLTPRQREVMGLVVAGHPSKNIAADLGISQRTVENHRASIMKRTGVKSIPALARLALSGASNGSAEPVDELGSSPPQSSDRKMMACR